jgi:hypothetical protein
MQFSRTADLLRHVSVVHLIRGKYRCPIDGRCQPFNRKDNLTAHMRRRHNIAGPGRGSKLVRIEGWNYQEA